jgi:hypothetical protein
MCNKCAKTVVSAWASSSAPSASSSTMTPRSSSFIATSVASAELAVVRTFSIVTGVAAATRFYYVRDITALKNLCTKTAQFAWRYTFFFVLVFVGTVWYSSDQNVRRSSTVLENFVKVLGVYGA